jgi:hypothetical protein
MLKARLRAREIFLLLCLLALSHRVFLIETEDDDNADVYIKMAKTVRALIRDWNSKHTDTNERDVMILNLGASNFMFNAIVKAIPRYNPIVVIQDACRLNHNDLRLGKPAFIVVLSREIERVSST